MVRDANAPIRVLLWLPTGLQQAILRAELGRRANLMLLDAEPNGGGQNAAALRDAMVRLRPDVVVIPVPAEETRRLVDAVGETPAVFVTADGRSALAYDRDVSADALVQMIHSIVADGA